MAVDFRFYRILCTAPPELEAERAAFEVTTNRFVEAVSMPEEILIAPASLPPSFRAANQKAALQENLRSCEFSIQIFGEHWPEPVFAELVDYAVQCVADPSRVARHSAVFFRNHTSAAVEVRELRQRLGCEVREFTSTEEFEVQLYKLLAEWYAEIES